MIMQSIVSNALEFTKNGAFLTLFWRDYPALARGDVLNEPASSDPSIIARLDIRAEGSTEEFAPGRLQLRKHGEDWREWVDLPSLDSAIIGLGLDIKWNVKVGKGSNALRDWINGTGEYAAVEAYLKNMPAYDVDQSENKEMARRNRRFARERTKKRRENAKRASERVVKTYLPGWTFRVMSAFPRSARVTFTSPDHVKLSMSFADWEPSIPKRRVDVTMPDGLKFCAKFADVTRIVQAVTSTVDTPSPAEQLREWREVCQRAKNPPKVATLYEDEHGWEWRSPGGVPYNEFRGPAISAPMTLASISKDEDGRFTVRYWAADGKLEVVPGETEERAHRMCRDVLKRTGWQLLEGPLPDAATASASTPATPRTPTSC